ncbi:MAG TPA: AI-2E family transporter [bacterium]|nr:AI-2E family transporter [bacterium]
MTQRELVGRTVTVLALIIVAWFLVWVISQITEVLVVLLISAILAAGFGPLVSLVERWRIPGGVRLSRGVAIFVLYLAMFAAILMILAIILIPAVNETSRFVQQLPQFTARSERWLADVRSRWPWVPDLTGEINRLPSHVAGLTKFGPEAAGVAFRLLGGFAAVITVLVFTFYMLLEGVSIKRGFLALFPPSERPRVDRVLARIGKKFGGWLRAQLLLSFSVAAPVVIGLSLLRMPYPLLLGIVAGIGELIPMVGPTLGAVVAILIALSQQPWQLIGVVIFYVVILNVEPHILVPNIMGHVVGLSPILTLVALLTGIKLLGILGGLLAVPVAAALQVIVAETVMEILPDAAPAPDDPPGP